MASLAVEGGTPLRRTIKIRALRKQEKKKVVMSRNLLIPPQPILVQPWRSC